MSAIDYMYALVALVFLGGGIYYFLQAAPSIAATAQPSIEIFSPSQGNVNESIAIELRIHNLANEIITLKVDGNTFSYSCAENDCSFFNSHTFTRAGTHSIQALSSKTHASAEIQIIQSQRICLDGTLENNCSVQLPLRCVQSQLIADCETCGCPNSQLACEKNGCVPIPIQLSISSVQIPTAFSGKNANILTQIRNDSLSPMEGIFLIYLDTFSSGGQLIQSIPQQIRINALASNSTQSFTHSIPTSANANYVIVRLFQVDNVYNPAQLLDTSASTTITFITDNDNPFPPTHLSYTLGGDTGIILEWDSSSSSDVTHYIIYRQSFGNQAFTAYDQLGITRENTFPIPDTNETLLYTIRAADAAGNLSEIPNPISIPGNAT